MCAEERDLVTFSDDDGNEFELEVVDYFDYEGQEYAVLIDPETVPDDEDEEAEAEVYIMKVVVDGDFEEFLPADEDKMEALSAIVEERLASIDLDHDHCGCGCGGHDDEDDEDDDEDDKDDCCCGDDEDDDECGCGCGCDKKE